MRRLVFGVLAIVLAFGGTAVASPSRAGVPDEIKHQIGYYDHEGAKVRYIITPNVASEVVGVYINYKPAKQARDGSWYRVMESQKFGANHWVYTTIQTEAVEFDQWVRYRNLYPKE